MEGAVVLKILHWTFRRRSKNKAYSTGDEPGYLRRDAGVKDGNGTIAGLMDEDDSILDKITEGTEVSLQLKRTATESFTVEAIIDEITFDVDIDGGRQNSYVASFSTNGTFT